jgi:hypothetical protein
MGLLDGFLNLFNGQKESLQKSTTQSHIRLGRYSDNNKSLTKTNRWFEAEQLFKEKKFEQSFETLFDYLRDECEDNVQLTKDGDDYHFKIFQGTKIISGVILKDEIMASVSLAKMEKASIPVMRRLLEMNYALFYTRYAMQEDKLYMYFDSPKDMASPSKIYYGLKELATKADKQDDLLVTDFSSLKSIDDSHVEKFTELEIDVKYRYFKKWIDEILGYVNELNQDSFSGGIGYMLLTLIYKLDFLITPEGKLLNEIETIHNTYWTHKEDKSGIERNQLLKEALKKLSEWSKEDVLKYFYRAKSTFAITAPKPMNDIADSIKTAADNSIWYLENNHNNIALEVMEYGIAYCQFSYSLPEPITQFFALYMQINHADFFHDLGYDSNYFLNDYFNINLIKQSIHKIVQTHNERYPKLSIADEKLNFNQLSDFNLSFLREIATLNFDAK